VPTFDDDRLWEIIAEQPEPESISLEHNGFRSMVDAVTHGDEDKARDGLDHLNMLLTFSSGGTVVVERDQVTGRFALRTDAVGYTTLDMIYLSFAEDLTASRVGVCPMCGKMFRLKNHQVGPGAGASGSTAHRCTGSSSRRADPSGRRKR
jgi:hypothetical protein